jgi:hypothetical protein
MARGKRRQGCQVGSKAMGLQLGWQQAARWRRVRPGQAAQGEKREEREMVGRQGLFEEKRRFGPRP